MLIWLKQWIASQAIVNSLDSRSLSVTFWAVMRCFLAVWKHSILKLMPSSQFWSCSILEVLWCSAQTKETAETHATLSLRSTNIIGDQVTTRCCSSSSAILASNSASTLQWCGRQLCLSCMNSSMTPKANSTESKILSEFLTGNTVEKCELTSTTSRSRKRTTTHTGTFTVFSRTLSVSRMALLRWTLSWSIQIVARSSFGSRTPLSLSLTREKTYRNYHQSALEPS